MTKIPNVERQATAAAAGRARAAATKAARAHAATWDWDRALDGFHAVLEEVYGPTNRGR